MIPPRLDLSPKPSLPPVAAPLPSPPMVEQLPVQTQVNEGGASTEESGNPLEELDVSRHLVLKKVDEDGPDIRGGHEDGLIVLATKANKNGKGELKL